MMSHDQIQIRHERGLPWGMDAGRQDALGAITITI